MNKNNQDFYKIEKLNQDKCHSAILKASSINKESGENISETENFIAEIEKRYGIDSSQASIDAPEMMKSKIVFQSQSWEDLCNEANMAYPDNIDFTDLLSKDEFENAYRNLKEIDKEFSNKTSIINKTDLSFLIIAIALQVAKTLIFPVIAEKFDYGKNFDVDDRLAHDDKSIKNADREAKDKFKNKHLKKHGEGAWINILYQTVPYDITKGSVRLNINMHGKYHRMYTLGHDPILGWLFGTANILTDCITFNNFQTNRISRIDPVTGAKKMCITPEIVPIGKMFRESYEVTKADKLNLPSAIFAQARHFKSDEFTKLGLPAPLLSSINENFASKLYQEHYDALCLSRDVKITGVSFVVSKLIDIIICLTHGLFREENESKEQFEVRTRKILLISNTIASTSTIINTAITKNPKKLDIGGLLNTLTHLFTDLRFIARIKQEFIENKLYDNYRSIEAELEQLYHE